MGPQTVTGKVRWVHRRRQGGSGGSTDCDREGQVGPQTVTGRVRWVHRRRQGGSGGSTDEDREGQVVHGR